MNDHGQCPRPNSPEVMRQSRRSGWGKGQGQTIPELRGTSGDQLQPDRLRHGMSAVVYAELGLRLLEMAAHGHLSQFEMLGGFSDLISD